VRAELSSSRELVQAAAARAAARSTADEAARAAADETIRDAMAAQKLRNAVQAQRRASIVSADQARSALAEIELRRAKASAEKLWTALCLSAAARDIRARGASRTGSKLAAISSDHQKTMQKLGHRARAAGRLARIKAITVVTPAHAAMVDGMTEEVSSGLPGMMIDAVAKDLLHVGDDEVYFLRYLAGTYVYEAATDKQRRDRVAAAAAAASAARDIRARGASRTGGKLAAIAAEARAAHFAGEAGAEERAAAAPPTVRAAGGAIDSAALDTADGAGSAIAGAAAAVATQAGCWAEAEAHEALEQPPHFALNSSVLRRLVCPQLGRMLVRGAAASAVHNVIAQAPAAASELMHSTVEAAHAGAVVLSTLLHVVT
jgi:hypothetical protein